MNVEVKCGDPAALAGYLYDECNTAERAAIEAHLAMCRACTAELEALGATRTALAAWTPPDAELGFRITSDRDTDLTNVLRPARWWQRPLPAWAQAAAAVLIFAAGAGVGMTRGPEAAAPRVAQVAAAPAVETVSVRDLTALEERLRGEMAALRTEAPPVNTSAADAALVQRVRTLLAESEQRQQRELALRLTQVVRDMDSQRRMDLSNIERTFGQMEGFTRPELANQRQMLNYLIQRTSVQRVPQQ
jgi:hypothetical protein